MPTTGHGHNGGNGMAPAQRTRCLPQGRQARASQPSSFVRISIGSVSIESRSLDVIKDMRSFMVMATT